MADSQLKIGLRLSLRFRLLFAIPADSVSFGIPSEFIKYELMKMSGTIPSEELIKGNN